MNWLPETQAANLRMLQSAGAWLAIGFILLLGIVISTFLLAERSRVGFDDVLAARDVRTAAVDLRSGLLSAEASQRGFVVNGNEIYLAPYDTGKSMAFRRLTRLKRLLEGSAEANTSIDRLTAILNDKFSEMDDVIALKRQRRDGEVAAIFNTNRGKALSDEANVFLTGIILSADDRLTAGVAEQRRNSIWLRWVTVVGGIFIIVVVGFAIASVTRQASQLSVARNELESLNSGLEQRIRERTRDLERANDEVHRFAYIVTHDLRAPLVNIMGFTSELESGVAALQMLIEQSGIGTDVSNSLALNARTAAAEDLPEAIGFIRSSTRKMDRLINAILQLSREGRRPLKPEPVLLAELIQSNASATWHQIKEAGGEIHLDLTVPRLMTDRLAMEQVAANLLDNAVKYRSKRPLVVEIRSKIIPGDRIAIEIQDNGRGIAGQDLDRIFDLFRRSGLQDQPGEGLGLAYVRSMVRRLGGDIRVQSKLDQGTTFTIELPIIPSFDEGQSA